MKVKKKEKFSLEEKGIPKKVNVKFWLGKFINKFNDLYTGLDSFSKVFIPVMVVFVGFWFFRVGGKVRFVDYNHNFNNLNLLLLLYFLILVVLMTHKPREPQGLAGM